jgi:hypothetical protein
MRWSLFVLFALFFFFLPTTPILAQDEPAEATEVDGREKRTVKLPAAIDYMVVGGSGKYLVAHLRSVQKLAIIDVKEAKVAKYLSFPSADILFACGAEKLFVIMKEQSIIQRYSLASFEREVSSPLPTGATAGTMAMGHASLGPILVGAAGDRLGNGSFMLLNPKTLKPMEEKGEVRGREFECYSGCIVRAAPNGQVFTSTRTSVSPSGFYTLVLSNGKPETHYEHDSPGMLLPSADGSRIYTSMGVYSNVIKPINADRARERGVMMPSATGDYYLQIAGYSWYGEDNKEIKISVHLAGDARPIATLGDLLPKQDRRSAISGNGSRLSLDQRLNYFPESSALTVVGQADSTLDIIKVDLDAELEKSGIDYLYVSSRPPLTADAGKPFSYQVTVKSKKNGVKIGLASGPDGMQVDASGKVSWNVPARLKEEIDVILSISDASGQETFQTFRLSVGGESAGNGATSKPPAVATNPTPRTTTPRRTTTSPKTGTSPPATSIARKPTTITPAKLEGDSGTIKLPAAADRLEVGGGGRYLVAHLKSLRKLAVIDLCEAKVAGYIAADDDQVLYGAGQDKVVVVLGTKNIISRWDIVTREREVAAPLDGTFARIAMGSASSGPIYVQAGGDRSSNGGGSKFLDLQKLTPIEVATGNQNGYIGGENLQARVSADGRTFAVGATVYTFDGRRMNRLSGDIHGGNYGGILIPSPDGEVLYAGSTRLSPQLRQLSREMNQSQGVFFIPAVQGRFYMALQFKGSVGYSENPGKQKVAMHLEGDTRPLVTLDDFEVLNAGGNNDFWGHNGGITIDKRLIFVPDAKVIATINNPFDSIKLRRFDLDEALESSGIDYLFVASRPPTKVKPGEMVNYQVDVTSKKGGLKFRLESGPDGMALSPTGVLMWKVPTDATGSQSIILAISDAADQEVFHTFQMQVEAESGAVKTTPTTATTPKPITPPRTTTPRREVIPMLEPQPPDENPLVVLPDPTPTDSSAAHPRAGKLHTWTDAASGRKLDAKFIKIEGDGVVVEKDGEPIKIGLDRFVREDLLWILGVGK